MAITSLVLPTISSGGVGANFHYLAIFICHLFSDGRFRTAHIIYDPNVFDHDLFPRINSICSNPIPTYHTDINQPTSFIWNGKDSADNMLTIYFFDPKQLALGMDHIMNQPFAYYRVVVFPSIFPITKMNLTSVFRTLQPKYDSRTLIVQYSPRNVSVFIKNRSSEQTKDHVTLKREPIFILNQQSKVHKMDLFNHTFGEYERTELIEINQVISFLSNTNKYPKPLGISPEDYILNYYHLRLRHSYIYVLYKHLYNIYPVRYAVMAINKRDYYKELSTDYEVVANDIPSEMRNFSYAFHMKPFSLRAGAETDAYPYSTIQLKMLFVYGSDFKRETHLSYIPEWIQIVASLLMLFIITAAITLSIIRRKLKLPHSSFLSSFIDCLIPFIGGGNIRMHHRVERWFFSILYFGAFFIVSVFVGDLLDSVVQVYSQEVNTFEQLTKINPPIYIDSAIQYQSNLIKEMLKRKMGRFHFAGNANIGILSRKQKVSFALIINKIMARGLKYLVHIDSDEILESLGEIPTRYVFQSNYYVNERIRRNVDKVTSSMMENGLYQFYYSAGQYRLKKPVLKNQEYYDDDLKALTMIQFIRPMILIGILFGLSTIVFIGEVFVFRWLDWRNRRVIAILPQHHNNSNNNNRLRKRPNDEHRSRLRCYSAPVIISNLTQLNGIQNRKLRRHSVP